MEAAVLADGWPVRARGPAPYRHGFTMRAGQPLLLEVPMPRTASVLALVIVCLAACSKNEPPKQANATPPAAIIAPAPPPEPVVAQPAAPERTVELHIPGTPEAKSFIAANFVKQPKRPATKLALAPDTAYDKAYRNAARADKLLQRHAYVVSFDDVIATNAVPLSSEYR
jgi:hypothetical protein